MRFGSFSSSDLFKTIYKQEKSKEFRTDIAGLRGIAVLMVTLCHFEIPGFGGGFIGPDIFFVLSGYLITGLLVKEYNRNINLRTGVGSVSIKAFYLRRARRILPAALFVIIAINLWAQFRLNILQVSQIKADSVWTIFFGANITFLRQATDYFAQNNAVSPLQHYWSLSVEEQFYTVWPVLFLAALSFSTLAIRGRLIEWQTRLRTVFTVIGIASFAWLLFEFTNSPTTAYFSTFSRAWELALGGLLSMVSFSSVAERFRPQIRALRVISLVAVIGAIGIVTPSNFGYTLVIPAVATGLLLLTGAHAKGDLVYRLLSSRVLNGLGAISFSLYLWHWPVFVFGRQEGWMETLPQKAIGVVVCIVLGTVSYFLVEKTFLAIPLPKAKKQGPPKAREFSFAKSRVLTSLTTFAVVAGLVGITYPSAYGSTSAATVASEDWIPPATAAIFAPEGSLTETTPGPRPEIPKDQYQQLIYHSLKFEVANSAQRKSFQTADYRFGPSIPGGLSCPRNKLIVECDLGSPRASTLVVLIGDSHAEMWAGAFGKISVDHPSIRSHIFSVGSCPNTLDVSVLASTGPDLTPDRKRQCALMHTLALDYIKANKPDFVVFSSHVGGVNPDTRSRYLVGAQRFISRAAKDAKNIIWLGETPNYPDPRQCLNRALTNIRECGVTANENKYAYSIQRGVIRDTKAKLIDTEPWFCLNGKCPLFIGNVMAAAIQNHISQEIAISLSSRLYSAMNRITTS